MRVSKTFSIDEAVLANLRALELETGIKINDLVNEALHQYTVNMAKEADLNDEDDEIVQGYPLDTDVEDDVLDVADDEAEE